MELMNQPFTGQLGTRLIELLDQTEYHTLNIVVAFAKNSGVLRIKDAFERFRKRGGKINTYVGVDLGGTSYEALTSLLLHTDSLNVVHSEKNQTFHPKIYQFIGEKKGLVVIGSHNLTCGGLWTNFESSVHIPVGGPSADEGHLLSGLKDYCKELTSLGDSFMPISAQDDIEQLLEYGYIFKEVAERVRQAKVATEGGRRGRLFGNGALAKLPSIASSTKEKIVVAPTIPVAPMASAAPVTSIAPEATISLTRNDEGETIWFETRSMTGGSRNILDLSKKSLVERGNPKSTPFDLGDPRFMRGGVEFFGLNPIATDQKKI